MGLFSFLKNKFSKKKPETESSVSTYQKGLEKSRKNFASRLDELSKRYAKINPEYFEELEEILIESDVGVELSIRLCEELLDKASKEGVSDPKTINEMLVDEMFVGYATKGDSIESLSPSRKKRIARCWGHFSRRSGGTIKSLGGPFGLPHHHGETGWRSCFRCV